MKTSVILTSQDRNLFGVTVRQESKTGFLNLADLQSAYVKLRDQHGWISRDVNHVIGFKDNVERMYYVLKKQGLINCSVEQFTETCSGDGIVKTLKKMGVYKTTGRAKNKTTSCNPYIWVLIAMEMNPMLYGEVVHWLTDSLILNRIEAGDMYIGLSRSVSVFSDVDYKQLAKCLNHIVFGRHENGIRNSGTEAQLKELHQLESNLSYSIDAGFINSFRALLNHLRDRYEKKKSKGLIVTIEN